MSKTILANVDGWTPVIDEIVSDCGLMSAVVFGRMWRFCQMKDGVCKASLETISEGIGVDRATVMRHARILCDNGYLKDLTPNLKNRPHIYADTGKASLKIGITTVAQNNTASKTVAESNTTLQKVIPTVAERNVTVAESHLNKDNKKDVKKQINKEPSAPKVTNYTALKKAEEDWKIGMQMLQAPWEKNVKGWQSFPRWLMEQEEAGRPVAQFCKWFMGDSFRAKTKGMYTPDGRKTDGAYSFKAIYMDAFQNDSGQSVNPADNPFDAYIRKLEAEETKGL